MHPIETAYKGLRARAAALEALVDQDTDRQIASALQTAYASLIGSAELLIELEDQSHSQLQKKLAAAEKSSNVARKLDVLASVSIIQDNFPKLLESGVLLSQGKDIEAIKHIAREIVKTAVGIGVALSGVKVVKDVADLIKTLEDLARTGQSFKFRKKQVQEASKLHKWCQAITIAGIAWSYAVQRYLLDISGKASATEDEVVDLVTRRMAKCSHQWRNKA